MEVQLNEYTSEKGLLGPTDLFKKQLPIGRVVLNGVSGKSTFDLNK